MATYPKRQIRIAVAVVAAAVLGVTLLPSVGEAAPQLTLAQAQAQLNALDNEAEAAQEAVNAADVSLAAGQKKLIGIQARVAASQKLVDKAEATVGQLAANAYRSGGVDTTLQLLTSDDPTKFLAQASELDGVERQQGDVLVKVTAAKQRLAQDKLAAAQLVGQLTNLKNVAAKNEAAVNARKADAQRLVDSLQAQVQAELLAARKAANARSAAAAARELAATRANRSSSTHTATVATSSGSGSSGGSSDGGSYSGTIAQIAIKAALSRVGDAYVWGATGPSAFDCSGLTMWAYAHAGIGLVHSSAGQASEGRQISESQIQPGDLVFYYSPIHHVAIYIGGGMIVHAANPSAGVQVAPMDEMPVSAIVRPY